MPSERKRGGRSPNPPGPARAPRVTEEESYRSLRLLFALAGLLVVTAALWFYLRGGQAQADLHAIAKQNVLLITIDTLRADALGIYGGPAKTPALDRLANEGVRFDFAHAHAVLTLPSHASILTGEYPYQHGVRENSGYRLAPKARTVATLLKQAGYDTAAFVGAFPVHSRFGLNQGFDEYDDRFGETRAPTEFVMPERPASEVVPLARKWIGDHSSASSPTRPTRPTRPWFVWVHVFDPHAPYRPPPPFDREYADRPYYGEVAATDAALAPLLDDVRRAERPTLVIVTGDHGESLGEHGEESHGLFAYESTLRVPLIVAEFEGTQTQRPHRTQRVEVSQAPARHIDILPTILEATGQSIPSDLPGRSLLPAQERTAGAAPRPSYFEAMAGMLNRGWAPLTGILSGRDKYIDLPIPERYDLASDLAELKNLRGADAAKDRTLEAALRGFQAALPGERRVEDPAAAAQLRALGYFSGSAPRKARYTEADDPKRLVDIDRAVHQAVEAFGRRQFDEAIQVYQQVIRRRPDMAIAYRHLAFVQWERGDVNGAIGTLQDAVRRGVTNTGIVTQLGGYLAETDRTSDAIALLERAAADAPADADTLNSLGIAYAHAHRRDDAERVFNRVLSVNPESAIPLENLGILALERNDVESARHYFERAVAADSRSSRAHADLGVVAMKRGDRAAAVSAWRTAVQLDPTNYDALYNLATTLESDAGVEAARPYLEQFVRTAPPAFYAKDIQEISRLLQSRPPTSSGRTQGPSSPR